MKTKTSHNILFDLVCSFLIVLIIPLGCNFYAKNELQNTILEQERRTCSENLAKAGIVMDQNLSTAISMTLQVSVNKSIISLLTYDKPSFASDKIYQFRKASDVLSTYTIDGLETNLFVILRKPDFILQRKQARSNIPMFYETAVTLQNMPYEDFVREYLDTPHKLDIHHSQDWVISEKPIRCISLVQSLPITQTSAYPQGDVFLLIDQDQLAARMREAIGDENSFLAIYDDQSVTLYGPSDLPDEQKEVFTKAVKNKTQSISFERDSFEAFYADSTAANIGIASFTPASDVMKAVHSTNRVQIFSSVLSLILGMAAAILFSYRHYRPIHSIAKMLPSKEKIANYQVLTESVSNIVNESNELKFSIQKQRAAITDVFLDKLFSNQFNSESQMSDILMNTDMEQQPGSFVSCAVSWATPAAEASNNMLNYTRAVISDHITGVFGSACYIHSMDFCEFAVLIVGKEEEEEALREQVIKGFHKVIGNLASKGITDVLVGIGDCRQGSYLNAGSSYRNARYTLSMMQNGNLPGPVAEFSEVSDSRKSCIYPLETEVRLLTAIRSGAVNDLNADIQQLEKSFSGINAADRSTRMMLNRMIAGTLFRLEEDTADVFTSQDKQLLDEIQYNNVNLIRLQGQTMQLLGLMQEICQRMNAKKNDKTSSTIKKICAYIEEKYVDPGLNASSLAEEFYLSDTYFPQYFKKHMGISFSDYLEKVRIDHALELLKDHTLTIEQISQMTGYGSSHSFRRSFKRIYNVSPTQYRSQP